MTALSYSSDVENMQAKPPRAEAASASRESSAAWAPRFRRRFMASMMGPNGKWPVTNQSVPRLTRALRDRRVGLGCWLQACGFSPPVLQRQRQFFRGLDAVAAATFGLVERGIGGCEQHLELRAGGPTRGADADGGIDRAFLAHDSGRLEGLAHAFSGDNALFQRTGQQSRELFAANATREIRDAQIADHHGRKQFQKLIAGRVTEAVVDALEMVDIEDQHRDGAAGHGLLLDHARAGLGKTAAVEHAGQR